MAIRTILSDRGDAGRRLDVVLRRHLADLELATRSRVQTWIGAGTVSINGHAVRRVATRVAAGDVLTVDIPQSALQGSPALLPFDAPLDILFEDDCFLAVNKPAGIVVHPTHAHPTGTLMNALVRHARSWPPSKRPSIVGRLDKQTSGLVLVAKTGAIHAALQLILGRNDSAKDYLALVYGRVPARHKRIDLRLRRDPDDRRRVIASSTVGAPSLTDIERLAVVRAPRVGLALLRCRLLTGRTHQIRVHLSANGWPIVGDPVYGAPRFSEVVDPAIADALRGFQRQALHAWRVSFRHPMTMAPAQIEAPLSEDMRILIRACGLELA
jgi:23S rRNA pseudouridine1911/1915/1917 synthase